MAYPATMQTAIEPRLAWASVLSLVLHGIVLHAMVAHLGPSQGRAGAGTERSALKVVSLPQAAPSPPPQAAAPIQPPQPMRGETMTPTALPLPTATSAPNAEARLDAQEINGWGPRYLPSALLDERPRVLLGIPSDLPELRKHPEGGTVTLMLHIGPTGKVELVIPESATLPEVFVESAVRAFYAAKFSPGRKNGVAVGALVKVEVRFEPLPSAESKGVISGTGPDTVSAPAPSPVSR